MANFYVAEHAPHNDVLRVYSGMTQETVVSLLDEIGNAYEFITEEDYNTKIKAMQKK